MMKRNIKMIGFDLDGTLLNSNKEISDYTRDVMREAVEQGVIILPATGRPADRYTKASYGTSWYPICSHG